MTKNTDYSEKRGKVRRAVSSASIAMESFVTRMNEGCGLLGLTCAAMASLNGSHRGTNDESRDFGTETRRYRSMSKYPKRGEDCIHTEDCAWGVDGWCDRPHDRQCVVADADDSRRKKQHQAALQQLVKLGDMIGDGPHPKPDMKRIEKEYRKAMREAGLLKSAPKDTTAINIFMESRVREERCPCGGALKQTRKGSLRAKCTECEKIYQLGERRKEPR